MTQLIVFLGGLITSFVFFIGLRLYIPTFSAFYQDEFLRVVPWFFMILSVALTLLGTSYLRNRQKQRFEFLQIDAFLTQKKYELGNQIIERENLEKLIKESEQEYRIILNAVSDAIFETDVSGNLLFLNKTWEKLTGFSIEESLGRNFFELFHLQDQDKQKEIFETVLSGHLKSDSVVVRLHVADGCYRSVNISISVLHHDRSRELRVVGMIQDIEDHRQTQKALDEFEKRYYGIVENAAGGIYQVTPKGVFVSLNPAMARIFGYSSPEYMMRSVTNVAQQMYVSSSDRFRFLREIERKRVVRNFEVQMKKEDGTQIWVNNNARVVYDEEGEIDYFEGSIEDISQRKNVEGKLREAKVLSDLSSRAKSEFLANMSHELRTPLNSIIGFSEIIKDEVLGEVGNRQYWEYAKDIYGSGQSLLKIINEILDISRIDAGDQQLQEGRVDLNTLLKNTLEFTLLRQNPSGIVVKNETDGLLPKIIGEELRIKQVLMNLLSNAMKFTPAGGRITITYEVESTGDLRLSITDTGIGMSEEEIKKALSPFGQVDSGLNRENTGTGLGLTLVESLMALHNGRLELFSQKGVGTTATIIFPAQRVAQMKNVSRDDGQSMSSLEALDKLMNEEPSDKQIH